jgi:hypothetical protein
MIIEQGKAGTGFLDCLKEHTSCNSRDRYGNLENVDFLVEIKFLKTFYCGDEGTNVHIIVLF